MVRINIRGLYKKAAKAFDASVITALNKAGAYYRGTIQRSMRWTALGRQYKPSPPGQPPKAIRGRGQLRRFVVYVVDRARHNVVIGHKKLGAGFVPVLHELGGVARRRRVKPGQKAQIAERNSRPVIVRIQTTRQAALANKFVKPARYPPRPYLSTAVEKYGDTVNRLFFDAFKNNLEKKLK